MGEAVANITKLALLHVLLDRVEEVFFRDLAIARRLVSTTVNLDVEVRGESLISGGG